MSKIGLFDYLERRFVWILIQDFIRFVNSDVWVSQSDFVDYVGYELLLYGFHERGNLFELLPSIRGFEDS